MRARTIFLLLVIALVAAFAALNWDAFFVPTALNLGFSTVQAPLGLVMLGMVVALVVLFVAYMAYWQGTVLMDTRRHTKELQAQRALADEAEASRFTELRGLLHAELDRLAGRVEQTQAGLRTEIRESANSLSAMIGEIDDRTSRRSAGPAT